MLAKIVGRARAAAARRDGDTKFGELRPPARQLALREWKERKWSPSLLTTVFIRDNPTNPSRAVSCLLCTCFVLRIFRVVHTPGTHAPIGPHGVS